MRRIFLFILAFASCGFVRAADSESMPQRTLRQIVERQKQLLADAEKQGENLDEEALRTQAQSIVHDYDRLLAASPDFAAGYASYGYFLGKVGMRKESLAMLLKANQLDADIPLVKNQIGNYLAEQGKAIEAAQYYLAAIKLDPKQPLYHYQLGTLLAEGRDTFLKSGEWTRAAVDHSLQQAFKEARDLAPDRFDLAYRYAESFYDVENPDWNDALKEWQALEAKAESPLEQQTMRLHEANVYLKVGQKEKAKALIDSVTDPKLEVQKNRLLPQLAEKR